MGWEAFVFSIGSLCLVPLDRQHAPILAELYVEEANKIDEASTKTNQGVQAIARAHTQLGKARRSLENVIRVDNLPPKSGTRIMPVSNWTIKNSGKKQIYSVGLGDKWEITVLLSITLSGEILQQKFCILVLLISAMLNMTSQNTKPLITWKVTGNHCQKSTSQVVFAYLMFMQHTEIHIWWQNWNPTT